MGIKSVLPVVRCGWELTSYVSFQLGYGTVTYATVGRETHDLDERLDPTNRWRCQ